MPWWPWVTREQYEAMRDARDRAEARYDALQARYEAFVALVAERSAPKLPPTPVAPAKPDPVARAIAVRSGTNLELRQHLTGWAAERRNAGESDLAIVRAMHGDAPKPDEGPTEREKAEAEAAVLDLLG